MGCSVEVKLHRYKEGTQAQNTFFVELWDVGGSNGHRNTRNVFYQPTHGAFIPTMTVFVVMRPCDCYVNTFLDMCVSEALWLAIERYNNRLSPNIAPVSQRVVVIA